MANVIKLKRGSGSDPSASDLVIGEVAVRTDTGKLFTKKDNGTIAEISGAGGSDIFINTLSSSSGSGGGSATFNGTATRFTLSNPPDVSAQQLLVSVNGVVQKPNSGTNPSTGFAVDGNDIIFAAAPETGASFFIVTYGTIGLGIPADNSVTTGKIADGTIVNADVNASAAIAGSKINPNFGSQDISTTGNLTLYGTNPTISFTDSNEDSDFRLFINAGKFKIQDASNSNADRFTVFTDGHIDIPGNLNCADGLDVTGEITATSHLDMPDNAKIKLGTSDDLQIFHDGTHSFIQDNGTGDLIIYGTGEDLAKFKDDGSVELYHDGGKKFETTSSGVTVTGTCTATSFSGDGSNLTGVGSDLVNDTSPQLGGTLDSNGQNIHLGDNSRVRFGASQDLDIYHNTHSYIENDTGNLYISNHETNSGSTYVTIKEGEQFGVFKHGTSEYIIKGVAGGATELWHDGNKKLQTATYGIDLRDQGIQDCFGINSGGNQFRMIVPTGTSGGFRILVHFQDGSFAFSDSIANFYNTGIEFKKDVSARDINPEANNTYDLGTSSLRWRNVYTNDLNLSNEGGANDVDGTWGSYTIQEGAEDLFLVNKRNGKKYKFNLTEVS